MQLQGSLCCFDLDGNGCAQRVLARIGVINTTNPVHSNPTYAPLIMESGVVPYFSAHADIEKTVLDILACVNLDDQRLSGRKANPSSGTPAWLATQKDLVLFPNEQEYYVNIGTLPQFADVLVSLRNRHYGDVPTGGAGEAKHTFVFGKSGAAKTVFGQKRIAAKAVQHKDMGYLIVDTKSDFALDGKHNREGVFAWSMQHALRQGGRQLTIVKAEDIRLSGLYILHDLLCEHLRKHLRSTDEKADLLTQLTLVELTDGEESIKDIRQFGMAQIFQIVARKIPLTWEAKSAEAKLTILQEIQQHMTLHERWWVREVVPYFSGHHTPWDLAYRSLHQSAFVILDIDEQYVINREHQDAIMKELFRSITQQAKAASRKGDTVNAEIVIDEAHRWIPQFADRDGPSRQIVDAVNTTRAFGVGWMFLSQRITAIDKDVFAQCHTKYYGRGLGVGADKDHLKNELGEEGLALYEILDHQEGFFFLCTGYELNLGPGGTPIAFELFGGDATARLMEANPHIWSRSGW